MSWLERARTELAQAKQGSANANARPTFGSFGRRGVPHFSLLSTDSTPFFEETAPLPPAETAKCQHDDIAGLPPAKTDENLPRIPACHRNVLEFTPQTSVGERLREASLAFLECDLAGKAAELGWGTVELFGVFNHPDAAVVNRRPASKGLVSSVALAPWPGTHITGIEATHAIIATGAGGTFRPLRRPIPNALPFWQLTL